MISIFISSKFKRLVKKSILKKTAEVSLNSQSVTSDYGLSIVIEDDDVLKQLNSDFRNIDTPTDVLSFSSNEVDPETGKIYLGDVIISYPQAFTQAKDAAQSIDTELQLLVIHGILHLLGFNHDTRVSKTKMWDTQSSILSSLGVTNFKLPE